MTYLLRNLAIQKVPHLSRLAVVAISSKASFIMPRFLKTKVSFAVLTASKFICVYCRTSSLKLSLALEVSL